MSPTRLSLGEIAELVRGDLSGSPEKVIVGVASLGEAGPDDLSFVSRHKYAAHAADSGAGALLLDATLTVDYDGPTVSVASVPEALAAVLTELDPPPEPQWGVHPDAAIGRGTRWQSRIAIGANTSVGASVSLGRDVVIGSGVTIHAEAKIGDGCRIGDGVTIHPRTRLGREVCVGAGTRIGTTGFGFTSHTPKAQRIPHRGGCEIHAGVEIGANCTVDAGSIRPTVIGAGTKIDNLVHVAHNVTIGEDCFILAQVGIAGSTVVEREAQIGGQAGLSGHLTVGAGARIAAQSGVIGDVDAGAVVSGYPARAHRQVLREVVALRRLAARLGDIEALLGDDG